MRGFVFTAGSLIDFVLISFPRRHCEVRSNLRTMHYRYANRGLLRTSQ
jgi:hypothetical protein